MITLSVLIYFLRWAKIKKWNFKFAEQLYKFDVYPLFFDYSIQYIY